MAQTIKLKRGTTTPTTSNIVSGEVAIDTAAQKLYINDAGTIKEIGGGGGFDPETATDINIGNGASVAALAAVAVGENSYANNYSVAFGDTATANQTNSVCVGYSTTVSGSNTIAIGYDARAGGAQSTVMGAYAGASSSGSYNLFLGYGAGFSSGTASNNIQINASSGVTAATETGAILIQTSKAKIEYTASNGFVFTEDVGGTNTSYDLSSLGGGGLTQAKSTAITLIFG